MSEAFPAAVIRLFLKKKWSSVLILVSHVSSIIQGAGVALVCSLAMSLWTGIGASVHPAKSSSSIPALNTLLCNVTDVNATTVAVTTVATFASSHYNMTTAGTDTTMTPER